MQHARARARLKSVGDSEISAFIVEGKIKSFVYVYKERVGEWGLQSTSRFPNTVQHAWTRARAKGVGDG